jgi:hypothetical protein
MLTGGIVVENVNSLKGNDLTAIKGTPEEC